MGDFKRTTQSPPSDEHVGRRNPSPGVHLQSLGATRVFLTVNTRDGLPWLANGEVQEKLVATWREATAWLIGDYLLMPDYLHAFVAPREIAIEIEDWIKYWKSQFRHRHNHAEWKFQSRGWHHRLRDDENCSVKWMYVMENPVRKGLVETPDEWTYKGKVFELGW